MIDLCGLVLGHPAIVDDELVLDLASPGDVDWGSLKAIGLASEAERGGPLYAEM